MPALWCWYVSNTTDRPLPRWCLLCYLVPHVSHNTGVLLPISFFTAEASQPAQLSQFGIQRSVGTAGGRPVPQITAVGGSPPSQSRTKHMSSGATGVWEGGWRSPMYRNRDREGTNCPTAHGMPILQHSAVGEVLRNRSWLPSRAAPKIHWMDLRW